MKTISAMVELTVVINKKVNTFFQFEKVRFVAVGAINTAADFAVLFTLASIVGVPVYLANIASTSTALVVSFILNKKAVFRNTDTTSFRQVALFLCVTLFGLWAIQGIVIWGVSTMLDQVFQTSDMLVLLIAKLAATVFSVVWNYLWYSRVVFSKPNTSQK